MNHSPDLIAALEADRVRHGMSHARFAAHIGIDKSLWSRVRRGLTPITSDVRVRIITARPDLWPLVFPAVAAHQAAA